MLIAKLDILLEANSSVDVLANHSIVEAATKTTIELLLLLWSKNSSLNYQYLKLDSNLSVTQLVYREVFEIVLSLDKFSWVFVLGIKEVK